MKYEIKFKFKNSSFLSIVEDMNPKRFDGSWQAMPSITTFFKIDQITKFAKIAKYQMAIFGNTPPIAEIIWVKNLRAIVVCGFLMK